MFSSNLKKGVEKKYVFMFITITTAHSIERCYSYYQASLLSTPGTSVSHSKMLTYRTQGCTDLYKKTTGITFINNGRNKLVK